MKKWLIIIAIAEIVFIIALLCAFLEKWSFGLCMFLPKIAEFIIFPAIATIIGGYFIYKIQIKDDVSTVGDSMNFNSAIRLYEDKNYYNAFFILKDLAIKGDARAQYTIANMLQNGIGIPKDIEKAFNWYIKSAEQGYAMAQNNLASMYYKDKNYEGAFKWFSKAVEQGVSLGQFNLGLMYDEGKGVSQNYEEALKWYSKAAEQGHAEAQHNLGSMYYKGEGVSENYDEAFKWYSKAAEQGHVEAQYNLGGIYYEGTGISQNYEEAIKWYRKAAKQGYLDAQYNLGFIYAKEEGIPQNYIKAYMWFNIAMVNGDEEAKNKIESLEKEMTPEQIAEAQEMAKRCLESNYQDCGEE